MDRYNETTYVIRQIIKQHQKFDHAWNHISDHAIMETIPYEDQKRGISSAINNFLLHPTESQNVKQLKRIS